MSTPWEELYKLASGTLTAIGRVQQANMVAASRSMELLSHAYSRVLGGPGGEVLPSDRRFADAEWSENPAFDLIKQAYLITAQWMTDLADSTEEIDPRLHHHARFWAAQTTDALSPANFPLTNPAVLHETLRTGGANLNRGVQNLMRDVQKRRISMVPENAFQVGKDLALTPGKVIYRNALIELLQYSPTTESVRAVPILVVPPWINRYYVMDMRPDNSLFKYLVEAGFTVFTISWRNPDSSLRHLTWDDYTDLGLLDALRVVKSITGAPRVNAVGYCLGGIILEVTAAYLAAVGDSGLNTVTLFTTHQDFTDAGDVVIFISEAGVKFLEWLMAASGGYLDGRSIGATFNMLRSNDLVWHYWVHNYLLGEDPPAFDLLYWNSDGTRVLERVHAFLIREFFLGNKLVEPDGIRVKGQGIDVRRITAPAYVVAAEADHIVPWKGAFRARELLGGPVRFVLTESGHIAGIINPPPGKKRSYWTNQDGPTDDAAWLNGATRNAGSWWLDWVPWLHGHSGESAPPPPLGSEEFPPIMDAPGSYVLEN